MKKNRHTKRSSQSSGGFDQLASDSDFYVGAPSEQPLYDEHSTQDRSRVRKTARHQGVSGRRKEEVDPREKMALLAILRSVIMIIFLLIAFFMLWKGIKIYEERVWMDSQPVPEVSPVMGAIPPQEAVDINEPASGENFADRIKIWREANRLIGQVDALLLRNHYDQAIECCQDALRLDPSHVGALERLGRLYHDKGMYPESVNAYIRLLSVDPSRKDLKKSLIASLEDNGDFGAVRDMAKWFHEMNGYDEEVQRHLANSLYALENYQEAVTAYERVLTDTPNDTVIMQSQANAYLKMEQYDKALVVLDKLCAINFRDPNCYRQIAVCHAQLGHGLETVQTMGKAAHLFGQNTVVGWMQDPLLDPVRMDRTFQAFADRVGGEEFRLYLEKLAQAMEGKEKKGIDPLLELSKPEDPGQNLLKPLQPQPQQ